MVPVIEFCWLFSLIALCVFLSSFSVSLSCPHMLAWDFLSHGRGIFCRSAHIVCVMMGLQKFPESKLVLLLQLLEVVDAFLSISPQATLLACSGSLHPYYLPHCIWSYSVVSLKILSLDILRNKMQLQPLFPWDQVWGGSACEENMRVFYSASNNPMSQMPLEGIVFEWENSSPTEPKFVPSLCAT